MNSNLQKFWMIADESDWIVSTSNFAVDYNNETRRLQLRAFSEKTTAGVIDSSALSVLLTQPSMTVDSFGTVAWWDADKNAVLTNGALGRKGFPVNVCGPLIGITVCDMALGFDDVLYLSMAETDGLKRGFIRFVDRRGRWIVADDTPPLSQRADLPLVQVHADRLAADPAGGIWVLDRINQRIYRVKGHPLADGLPGSFEPTVFRPLEENPDAPGIIEDCLPSISGETLVNISCAPDGKLALLSWNSNNETLVRLRSIDGTWYGADVLANATQAVSCAWLSNDCLAVIPSPQIPARARYEAFVYRFELSVQEKRYSPVPAGGYYPLLKLKQHLFANGVTLPPHYPVDDGFTAALLPVSVASFHESGEVRARILDAGSDSLVWHRLYLEAKLPPGSGLILSLAATNDPQVQDCDLEWNDHYFGTIDSENKTAQAAQGVWVAEPSEIPHHRGMLGCKPVKDCCGLFTVLIQRPGRKVRSLAGRYLHIRLVMQGKGHMTPEIAAIRVYGPAFSYRDKYLPELYREELFGDDADAKGNATGADFLNRFLNIFEGVLTPLEDRVAAAQILMDPTSTSDEALEWLGSWMGILFEQAFPVKARRAWIAASHRLYQTRGTLAGLQLALEIATGGSLVRQTVNGREQVFPRGGALTAGRILVIEDFRLRRTFASILGADVSVSGDPLLPGGLLSSANSFVGDTLVLGEEENREFLALFRHVLGGKKNLLAKEENAVFDLYDKLAHRVTVLVHNEIRSEDMGLLRKIVTQETPVHVDTRVVNATWPLLVGLSSLIEVDTYITVRPPRSVARVDESRLGENAFIRRVPSLDPRLTH